MTHAALQDLVKKWRDEAAKARESGAKAQKRGNQDYAEVLWQAGQDAEAYADELSAALSAMEGEAVAWQVRYRMVPGGWGQWHDWSLPDRPETINGWDAEYRALYTAPPPQQADLITRALAYLGPHLELGTFAAPDWAIQLASILTGGDGCGTPIPHIPTPSPGPQGDGEVDVPKLQGQSRAWFACCDALDQVSPDWMDGSGTGKDKAVAAILGLKATPPQPEAQVSDAMVDKSLHIWFTENQTGSLFERMHAVLTAALTTSGRDGDVR